MLCAVVEQVALMYAAPVINISQCVGSNRQAQRLCAGATQNPGLLPLARHSCGNRAPAAGASYMPAGVACI